MDPNTTLLVEWLASPDGERFVVVEMQGPVGAERPLRWSSAPLSAYEVRQSLVARGLTEGDADTHIAAARDIGPLRSRRAGADSTRE